MTDLAHSNGNNALTIGQAVREGIENGVGIGGGITFIDKWIGVATLLCILAYWALKAATQFRVFKRSGERP